MHLDSHVLETTRSMTSLQTRLQGQFAAASVSAFE